MKKFHLIIVISIILFCLACEKEAPVEINLTDPSIKIHSVPDVFKWQSEEQVLMMVKVEDPQGVETLDKVSIEIKQGSNLKDAGLMWDDGLNGDIIAENGTFTYSIIPKNLLFSLDPVYFTFLAEDMNGNFSPEIKDTIDVKEFIKNDPPQIIEITGPISISRSQQGNHLLTAKIDDPQGLNDIQKVFFNSFRPDGTASSGNPFFMYDTGANGDVEENDGIYSFVFTISPSNALGNYRFEIQAQDKSGAKTDVVVHTITVVQ